MRIEGVAFRARKRFWLPLGYTQQEGGDGGHGTSMEGRSKNG